ncbi:hypothetical protein PanWU01x14_174630 [Parasponia andersonii]|uniref:Uncharacterized protein n=1 Tax=Parasponia andersonii TaxID=3476 RepID=A0A2P5C8E3_PARAD|nr:hypothetical protein PanWU01x14_174630 [Parasponia andersonii]
MAIFDPDSMWLRYIYIDDPCDDKNPTRPVWSQMDAGIFTGDKKSERPLFVFSVDGSCSDGWRPARGGAGEAHR